MASRMTSALAFGVGFGCGWAVRSLADSPQAAGVKLLEIALNAREQVGRWAAAERDRLDDMLAEARSRVELATRAANDNTTNGSGVEARTMNEEA